MPKFHGFRQLKTKVSIRGEEAFIIRMVQETSDSETDLNFARPTSMLALRTQRLFAPLSRNALPRLSCARQLCTPAAKPEEPADDAQPKLLYEGGKNQVRRARS